MKPNFAIINEQQQGEYLVLTIDTSKATYQGVPWRTMGDFGKRKFENFLVLSNAQRRIKPIYV